MLSPGLSLVALITGFYLPNNDIIYLAAFFRTIFSRKVNHILFLRSAYFSIGIGVIFLVRATWDIGPTISDINFLVTYAALPFVALFFTSSKSFVNAFITYAVIVSAYSWIQQVLRNFGGGEVLQHLLTYPTQVATGYIFDIWAPHLYRVPGFQLESSQFSFMLCLALALMYIGDENRGWKKTCLFTVTTLANGSTTGFGGLLIVYLSTKKINIKLLGTFIALILAGSSLYLWTNFIDIQLAKIYDAGRLMSADFSSIKSDRIIGFIRLLETNTFIDIILGKGLDFYGGYDIFSISVIGLGIVGFCIWASYFFSFFTRENLLLIYLISFYSISNGALLDPNYHIVFIYMILRYREFIEIERPVIFRESLNNAN